jgi:hypothetical protein
MKDEQIIRGVLGIRTRGGRGMDVFIDNEPLEDVLADKFGCSWKRYGHPIIEGNRFYSIVGEVIIVKLEADDNSDADSSEAA